MDELDGTGEEGAGGWGLVFLKGRFAGLACGCKYTAVAMIGFPLVIVLCMLAM